MVRRTNDRWALLLGVLLVVAVCLQGCAFRPMPKPDFCDKDDTSVITDVNNKFRLQPNFVEEIMILSNKAALKFAPLYSSDACFGMLDNLRAQLKEQPRPTYYAIAKLVLQNVKYVNAYTGSTVIIVGDMLGYIALSSDRVSDCDALIMYKFLDKLEDSLLADGYTRTAFLSIGNSLVASLGGHELLSRVTRQ